MAVSADGSGRLRALYDGKNFEPYAAEVPPTMATVFAFLRADSAAKFGIERLLSISSRFAGTRHPGKGWARPRTWRDAERHLQKLMVPIPVCRGGRSNIEPPGVTEL